MNRNLRRLTVILALAFLTVGIIGATYVNNAQALSGFHKIIRGGK